MPFYPGPGLGGHCIPIDPFYLAWKAREHEQPTRFIELAGEINLAMPRYVIGKLEEALDMQRGMPLGSACVLVIGLAYKKNVSDTREAPSLKLLDMLDRRGTSVTYHDPHVPRIPVTREHPRLAGRESVALTADTVKGHDAVLIVTDHDEIDYELIAQHAPLVVDTRNALASRKLSCAALVKA